ncbi:MAG: 1-(5-phosphoribosyl)-5-[(5-phosphoribosylamino)methylideneamino]imidazole-4-carboxamide isomerase [Deltaproteobacteria bacterium]|nr:1-(5-phosphoribosyl)-5-[(5-phosphoribosylamino)methylideneamino]imidazole-4-carboxamide isomerase [Deltaproteobacteria bacterium]
MFLIPAIDLHEGKCVRVRRGELDTAKTYYEDPLVAAKNLRDAGAGLLHVVDLDAAVYGGSPNRETVERLAALPGLQIQVGGGVRELDTVEQFLGAGARRVVIGTMAVNEPETVLEWIRLWPGRLCVGLDAREGRVAVKGWTEQTDATVDELAKTYDIPETAAIVFTDITRDGMETGVHLEEVRRLARMISVPVIASGGVASLDDLRALAGAPETNIVGVISGRAVYEGRFNLNDAFAVRREDG